MRTPKSSSSTLLALAVALFGCGGSAERDGSVDPDDHAKLEGAEVAKSALARSETPSTANLSVLGEGNRAFAFGLYHRIAKGNAGKNLVFSPYSISTALAMTYAGARGTTASEMKSTLHFTLEQTPLHEAFNAADRALASRGTGQVGADGTPFRLRVDNSLWAQRGFPIAQPYLDTLAVNYGAGVYLTDFATNPEGARGTINDWVSQKTEKLIPELLPPGSIATDTALVLTNTVYFNASWKTKFEKEATRDAPFTRADGSQVTASMMHAGLRIPYARGADYQAIALPYASDDLSFVAVLPDVGAFDGVEQKLSQTWFDALRAALSQASVAVSFPKLDYKAQTSLKQQLMALGMESAFGNADFTGISSTPLQIDDVIHEAVIKVFEGGTIAAAATAVTIRTTSAPLFEQTVDLDRPFLYAIVDGPTGQVLFLGRVMDPTTK